VKSNSSEVVVIGAGIMGVAAAMNLASRGHTVTLLEQFALDHDRGSSHGASRIFRLAYEEVDYVQLAQKTLPLWREAESQLGTELIRQTGALDMGPPLSLDRLSEALSEANVSFERLSKEDAEEQFTNYLLPEGWEVIHQRDGGVTYADRALRGLTELARRCGARVFSETRVSEISCTEGGMRVETTAGAFSSDSVVVTAAGWANKLLSKFDVSIPLRVTCEHVGYYERIGHEREDRPQGAELQRRGYLPFIWHDEDPEVVFYGLPNGGTDFIKVGQHGSGPEIDPDIPVAAQEERLEPISRFVESRMRGLGRKAAAFETCLYASTPDDDFVIDRVDNLIMAVGFGGHGFKFAPIVGKMIADLVEGKEVTVPRFSMMRFASAQAKGSERGVRGSWR
jgi:sarcosine oxidase